MTFAKRTVGLTSESVEDTLALLYGYTHRHEAFTTIYKSTIPSFVVDERQMYVEWFLQTNDVENIFNMLKAILKREGCGTGRGMAWRNTLENIALGMKKLQSVYIVLHDTRCKFSVPKGNRRTYENKGLLRTSRTPLFFRTLS